MYPHSSQTQSHYLWLPSGQLPEDATKLVQCLRFLVPLYSLTIITIVEGPHAPDY